MGRSTRVLKNFEKKLAELSEAQANGSSLEQKLKEAKRSPMVNRDQIEELEQALDKNAHDTYRLVRVVEGFRKDLKSIGCYSDNPDIRVKLAFVADNLNQIQEYFKTEYDKDPKVQEKREAFLGKMEAAGAAMTNKELRKLYRECLWNNKTTVKNREFRNCRKQARNQEKEDEDDAAVVEIDLEKAVANLIDSADPMVIALIRNDGYQATSAQ